MKKIIVSLFMVVALLTGCSKSNTSNEEATKALDNAAVNDLFEKYGENDTTIHTSNGESIENKDDIFDDYEVAHKKLLEFDSVIDSVQEAHDYADLQMIYYIIDGVLDNNEEILSEVSGKGKICVTFNDLYNGKTDFNLLEEYFVKNVYDTYTDFQLGAECNKNGVITIVIYDNMLTRVMILNEDGKIITANSYKDENDDYMVMDVNYRTEERHDENADLEKLDYIYKKVQYELEDEEIAEELKTGFGDSKVLKLSVNDLLEGTTGYISFEEFFAEEMENSVYFYANCNATGEVMLELDSNLNLKVYIVDKNGEVIRAKYLFDDDGEARRMSVEEVN